MSASRRLQKVKFSDFFFDGVVVVVEKSNFFSGFMGMAFIIGQNGQHLYVRWLV